jgi:hypothetical protein
VELLQLIQTALHFEHALLLRTQRLMVQLIGSSP